MVKVAVAQIKVIENIDKNLLKILDFIDRAKSRNADIVCFPETCLNPLEKNTADISKQIKKIQEKCKEKSIWCIFGTYVHQKNKVKNVIFLINRLGKIKYEYNKIHLWRSEKGKVTAGKTDKVINTEFGKIGIIDCWDCAFPSFIQKLSRSGARIIFCPVYEVDYSKDKAVFKSLPLVRAFENLAFFIWCDAFTGETLSKSYICHPLKILKKIENKEGIIFAKLNLNEIDSLKKHYDHLN